MLEENLGPDFDDPIARKTFGETIVGAPLDIIYNLYWLDFANNNDGSWLIHLNYIIDMSKISRI